jgi:hypothetical protein
VWEAVHILDALLKNRSEIQPDTLHADTQGQSEPVFGLCRLLGIKLMPRMRGLSDAVFYRPAKSRALATLRLAALLAVLAGSLTELPLVWAIADVAMGAMTLVNVVAIVALSRWVVAALADYEAALTTRRELAFKATDCANLPPCPPNFVW